MPPTQVASVRSLRKQTNMLTLLNTLIENAIVPVNSTLKGWVEKSTSFPRYIKKSMIGSIIASRFVDPNKKKRSLK